jgi:2-oxo-4-hydroxy-4-carboxy-5-ureidoimidazoline decarboxylase
MAASQWIDRASLDEARRLLHAACGSTRWVEAMLARRPFGSEDRLLDDASEVWFGLNEGDWREAFAQHPRIGDREALARRFPSTHALSAREQAGVAEASRDVLDLLATRNDDYVERFGYIFIVCASGLSAGEMLAMLETRLRNPPDVEIRIAAAEQARITALRLSANS